MSALYFRVPALTCYTCITAPSGIQAIRLPVLQVHLLRYPAMTAQLVNCALTSPSSPAAAAAAKLGQMDRELPIFSVMERHQEVKGDSAGKATDAESGISAGESELCVEHETELDWFCGTEQKLICSHCAIVGDCRGHSVTPLVERVTGVRVSAGDSSQ